MSTILARFVVLSESTSKIRQHSEGTKIMPTAARKTAAPAQVSAAEAPAAPPKPALDLASLVVEDAPQPKHTRNSDGKPNPFVAILRESHERKVGKTVTVPDANAKDVVYLIRQASNELKLGATIVEKKNSNGTTTVHFAGKQRRARKTKAQKAAEQTTQETAPATA